VEGVFEVGGCFRLVAAFFLFRSCYLAHLYHVRTGRLFVAVKHYPVRLLPDVTVELLVAIERGNIHSAYSNNVSNLNKMRQLAELICEKLNRRKSRSSTAC
jgi:hypothetical protein